MLDASGFEVKEALFSDDHFSSFPSSEVKEVLFSDDHFSLPSDDHFSLPQ
jgi:hypothetical protein